jgi:hypothetical protein
MHKAQQLEGFRFGTSAPLGVLRRKATELNLAGLASIESVAFDHLSHSQRLRGSEEQQCRGAAPGTRPA